VITQLDEPCWRVVTKAGFGPELDDEIELHYVTEPEADEAIRDDGYEQQCRAEQLPSRCHTVVCDTCGASLESPEGEIPCEHYPAREEAEQNANDAGWRIAGGRVTCDSCPVPVP
jgi:hypothetical protein